MNYQRQVSRTLDGEHRVNLELLGRVEQAFARAPRSGNAGNAELIQLAGVLARHIEQDVGRHFDFEESELFPRMSDAGDGEQSPTELEAFALEHDLDDADVEQLTRELEAIGLDVRDPRSEEDVKPVEQKAPNPDVIVGSADSLQLFLADVGRHKLLTASEEVTLAKAIERGDMLGIARQIERDGQPVLGPAEGQGHSHRFTRT